MKVVPEKGVEKGVRHLFSRKRCLTPFFAPFFALLAAGLLAGCGQKGPLLLPDPPAAGAPSSGAGEDGDQQSENDSDDRGARGDDDAR
ncbi:MAG TPA: lipoprotein [Gammaproteobacteria bacterium]